MHTVEVFCIEDGDKYDSKLPDDGKNNACNGQSWLVIANVGLYSVGLSEEIARYQSANKEDGLKASTTYKKRLEIRGTDIW